MLTLSALFFPFLCGCCTRVALHTFLFEDLCCRFANNTTYEYKPPSTPASHYVRIVDGIQIKIYVAI